MTDGPEFPVRPLIPPAAGGAIAVTVVAGVLLELAWHARVGGSAAPLPAALLTGSIAAGGLLVAVVRHRGVGDRRRAAATWVIWSLLGALTASVSSGLWMARMEAAAQRLEDAQVAELVYRVHGDPRIQDRGSASSAQVRDAAGNEVARVRLTSGDQLEGGETVRAITRIRPLGEDAWARSRYLRGEVAAVEAVRITGRTSAGGPVSSLRARLLAAIDPASSPGRALIAGVVCGRTTELAQTEADGAFATTGLSHLVAVSGGHLALVAALAAGVLERLRAVIVRSAILVALMAAYVLFTGGAPSAVRSLVMVAASLVARGAGRRPHGLSGLSIAVIALVAEQPGVVFDLGFQLSAASVLGIHVLAPYIAYHIEILNVPPALARALAATCAAQVMTVSITLPVFGALSLIAPVANLVAGPLMSALLVIGLLTVPVAALIPAASQLMLLPGWVANMSIWVAELLARIPHASLALDPGPLVPLIIYGAVLTVFVCWRRLHPKSIAFGCLVLGAAVALWAGTWRLAAPPELVILDVGQADAILIRDGPRAVLVDAGVDDRAARALARQNVLHLDAIVITHWDRDHWGGIADILRSVPTDALIVAADAAAAAPDEVARAWNREITQVSRGDRLMVGGFSCRVIWPRESVVGDENGESLCLAVEFDDGVRSLTAVLTGDTEADEERAYMGDVGDIDILKVGHHGSKVSVDGEVLGVLRPEVAVASAGEGNRYGHPSRACTDALAEAGTRFLCTMDAGDVTLTPGRGGVGVRTGRRWAQG